MHETLTPVKVTCGDTDCAANLHCFNATKGKHRHKEGEVTTPGACRRCGINLIDWQRMHQRDPEDVRHTFEALRREWIRHEFWHREFNQHALNHARRKGRMAIMGEVERRLAQAIGQATSAWDGRGVPLQEADMRNVFQYAQHAVAACCRRCVEKWHGIEKGRALTRRELRYFAALVRSYLDERLPIDLAANGIRVPPIRRAAR